MRSGIVALVVSREPGEAVHTVLEAVGRQTLAPEEILLLDCSPKPVTPDAFNEAASDPDEGEPGPHLSERTRAGVPFRVVDVHGAVNLGDAIARAAQDAKSDLHHARWWWILHEDSIPEDTCLAEQWMVADLGKTIACVGPKQISADGTTLLELGIDVTSSARRLERVIPGEIDQGQYDATSDVLAVGTAGMLLSPAAWKAVRGFDPVLGPFGDGLDFGRRLHLAGYRVVVAPKARLRHGRNSLTPDGSLDKSFEDRRFAQLYNWTKAVPAVLVPLLLLWLALWTPIRAFVRLFTSAQHLVRPELAAYARLLRATPRLIGARHRAAQSASVPARSLRPLEMTARRIRMRKRELRRLSNESRQILDPRRTALLREHSKQSCAALFAVLTLTCVLAVGRWWGYTGPLTGGAWTDLPDSAQDLWDAAFSSWVPGGDGMPGPADPFLIPLAFMCQALALVGISPDNVALGLIVSAGPLSALTAWCFVSRLEREPIWRALGAVTWSLLPALTLSAGQGRLAPILAHVLLPLAASTWLSLAGLVLPFEYESESGTRTETRSRRSGALWRYALVGALIGACVPWMILILCAGLIALILTRRAHLSALFALIPAATLLAPSLIAALSQAGRWRALLTPAGADAPSPIPAAFLVVAGLPASGAAEPALLIVWAIPGALLLVSSCLLLGRRLVKPESSRANTLVPALSFLSAALLISLAVALKGVEVGAVGTHITRVWTAPLLSIAALLLLGTASYLLPHRPLGAPCPRPLMRILSASAALALLSAGTAPVIERVLEAPSFKDASTSSLRGGQTVRPSGPLVAAVSAQAEASPRAGRVLVLDADPELAHVKVELFRGEGPSLLDSTPLTRAGALNLRRAHTYDEASDSLRELALTLIVYPDDETILGLADHGVDTILVPHESTGADTIAQALNRAGGVEKIGDTDAGKLWRLRPRGLSVARARLVNGAQWINLDSDVSSVHAHVPEGTKASLYLAERCDPGWKATLDGRPLNNGDSNSWFHTFTVEGSGTLTVVHDTWWRLIWQVLVLAVLALSAIGAIPLRKIT